MILRIGTVTSGVTRPRPGNSETVRDVATRIAGRYRIDARLGGGGMADVFDAHDELLDRPVAVKLLRGIDDAGAATRFAEEIRLTARVNHPNIVALYDAGEFDGSPFLVLERVTGGTLAGEMSAGPMDPQRVATLGEQLASALSHSHAAGIVHRDVKPSNILLTNDGSVRLADFGIAVTATATRLTVTGTIAGSAGYVSPEQVLGTGAGAASDIYALGLVLLECLTGAPPWSGTTVEVALARISLDPPIPADLSEEWQTLLRAMTAREPAERPPIDLVGFALSKLAVEQPYDQALFAAPAPPRDGRVPAAAGMTMMVLLVAAFVTLTSSSPTQLAAAAGSAPVNVPVANAVLEPAVMPSAAPALADRGARQFAEAARRRAQRARAAAAADVPPRTVAQTPPTGRRTATATSTGDSADVAAVDDRPTATLPRVNLPRIPTTTTTTPGLPDGRNVDKVVDTVDPVAPVGPVRPNPDTATDTVKGKGEVRRSAKAAKVRAANRKQRELQRTIDRVIQSFSGKGGKTK